MGSKVSLKTLLQAEQNLGDSFRLPWQLWDISVSGTVKSPGISGQFYKKFVIIQYSLKNVSSKNLGKKPNYVCTFLESNTVSLQRLLRWKGPQ